MKLFFFDPTPAWVLLIVATCAHPAKIVGAIFRPPTVVLVIAAGCALWFWTPDLARWLGNQIYPDLQAPYDNEAPPTPITFPASTEISTAIGGKGEGLNCSIPQEHALFKLDSKEFPPSLQFRQACVYHDYCYRHGAATYGYQQVDCDFKLLEHSYRLCRMIAPTDTQACLANARVVLAGVRAGGAGSFQEGARSSYFEFDPMPDRADYYVVARLVSTPENQPQKVANSSESAELQRSVMTYSFQRGDVKPRLLTWGKIGDKDYMPKQGQWTPAFGFPRQAIPTPPQVLATGSGEILLAAARQDMSQSGVWHVAFPTPVTLQNTGNLQNIAGDWPSTIEFERLLPASKDSNDAIASIKFYHPRHDGVEMLSVLLSEPEFNAFIDRESVFPPSGQSAATTPRVQVPPAKGHHHRWRYLQAPPVIGRFSSGEREEILLLRRPPDERRSDTSEAEGSLLTLRGAGTADQSMPILIPLPESSEPVAPVAIKESRTGLLSVVAPTENNGGDKVVLEVRDLKQCDRHTCGAPVKLDTNLDKSWVRMPVQVLGSREQQGSDLVFFSRVSCAGTVDATSVPTPCEEFELVNGFSGQWCPPEGVNPRMPRQVVLEFQYHRLLLDSTSPQLYKVGGGRCRVALRAQLEVADIEGQWFVPEIRRALHGCDSGAAAPESDDFVMAQFARFWSNSQVIPGRIFKRQRDNDMLDVAVIFSGDLRFSLLMAGRPGQGEGYRLAAFAPKFFQCD